MRPSGWALAWTCCPSELRGQADRHRSRRTPEGIENPFQECRGGIDPKSEQAGSFKALGISKDQLTDLNKLESSRWQTLSAYLDGVQKAAAQELFHVVVWN